jgi:hypothetical protein
MNNIIEKAIELKYNDRTLVLERKLERKKVERIEYALEKKQV